MTRTELIQSLADTYRSMPSGSCTACFGCMNDYGSYQYLVSAARTLSAMLEG
jgi:hypothetical protein